MVVITKKSQIEKLPEYTEIVWKEPDGRFTMATLVHCYCGKKVVSSCVTLFPDADILKKFEGAETFYIDEMEGDAENETCDC